jgi:hypothetical protein
MIEGNKKDTPPLNILINYVNQGLFSEFRVRLPLCAND